MQNQIEVIDNHPQVKINNYLRDLLISRTKGNDEIRAYKIRGFIQEKMKLQNIDMPRIAQLINVDYKNLRNWFGTSKRDIGTPISKLIQLCETLGYSYDELYETIEIFGNTNSKKYRLPRTMTPKLAYLLGYIIGDGHLANPADTISNGSLYNAEIRITTADRHHLECLQQIFKELFGIEPPIYTEGNFYRLICRSKVIHLFLARVCEIPVGNKKSQTKVVPIVYSDIKFQKYFLSGFFDADGSVYKYKGKLRSIRLKQHNRQILVQCKDILERSGIEFVKIYEDNGYRNNKRTFASVMVIARQEQVKRFINTFFSLKLYDKGVKMSDHRYPAHIAIIPDGKSEFRQ